MLQAAQTRWVLNTQEALRGLGPFLERGGDLWFLDTDMPTKITLKAGKGLLTSMATRYQHLEIVELEGYGLCMILDGKVQLAQSDEFIYHELLVHPACVIHGNPKRALVLGGGDGCAARELLRYPEMEEVVVVDLDEKVVELFSGPYSELNHGSFNDPRVKVVCEDAFSFLERIDDCYDVVVSDLTEPYDPIELAGDLSVHLYSRDAYSLIFRRLNAEGVFVCQTGGILNQPSYDRYHMELVAGIRSFFPNVSTAYEFVPSFEALWTVTVASAKQTSVSPAHVDEVLMRLGISGLKYYDGMAHQRAFTPPRYLNKGKAC